MLPFDGQLRRGKPDLGVHRLRHVALLLALALWSSALPTPAQAAKPGGFEHLLTPPELEAQLDAVVDAYPGIAHKLSIGQSFEGREIWALKLSDNASVDEDEPEVVVMGQIHAREWISQSLALYLIETLTSGYGVDERVTAIVDEREVYVIPTLNPDGAAYDLASDGPRSWRKSRQPVKGSSEIGIDLNRNFGFSWRCCGGGSDDPAHPNYRGWAPWVAPEVAAYRDFIDSRVIGGRQQLSLSLTFHSAGEMVLWPYAYTRAALPRTMSADDYTAMAALGRHMASLNGYRPMQGSRLYVADGDHDDWLYYEHRVMSLTFELAAFKSRYYPTLAEAQAETQRNREAVLWFLEQADCPYRPAGLATTHCGPLSDDFEIDRGWTVDPFATDTATGGRFERAVPQKTRTAAGIKQRAVPSSGQSALVTGAASGANANANDLDGGVSSAASAPISLGPGSGWRLSFNYTFAHNARARKVDFFRVSVVDGTARTVVFSQLGRKANRNAVWTPVSANLDAFAGRTVRILVEAADHGIDSLIEAAVDDVRVYRLP
jgi:carboxypeptidase T